MKTLVGLALLLAGGCGSEDFRDNESSLSTGRGEPAAALTIEPENAVLVALAGTGSPMAFTARATLDDGSTIDVTSETTFSASSVAVGGFSRANFTATGARGGRIYVEARYGDAVATTALTVRLTTTLVVTGAPMDAATRFGGAVDVLRNPSFLYPQSGVLLPPNLRSFNIQWNAGVGTDLYELRFRNDVTDITVFTTAASYQLDSTLWTYVAETNRGGSRGASGVEGGAGGGVNVELSLRATSSFGGVGVGTATPIMIGFAKQDLSGAIYYWTTTNEGIIRYDFGDPEQAPESYYTRAESGRCVACHVLTRDGSRMAFTYDGGNYPSGILDVASRALTSTTAYNGNFQTFDPSGALLVSSSHGTLTLRDGTTANALGTVPTAAYATQPDWSPSGTELVYAQPESLSNDWGFTNASIVTIPWDGSLWGTPTTLVSSNGMNNYYPSFSPDGEWILFNRSTGDSYDDYDARLFAVRASDPTSVVDLASANGIGSLTNSWPRWSPFVQKQGEKTGDLLWFAFSSKRAYGNGANGGRPQIWMAAFEPGRISEGQDPSYPAFWLPFQNISTNNHIAQWTEQLVNIIE